MNNDLRTLKASKLILEEIKLLKEKTEMERERLFGKTTSVSHGAAGGQGMPIDEAYAEWRELENERKKLIMDYVERTRSAEDILRRVSDPHARLLLRLLYVEGMTVSEAMDFLHESESTIRRAKRRFEEADGIG